VALLAQNPGDGVHDVGLAAAIGPNNARQPAAAEGDLRLFAERFEAHQLDFAQFQQDFPFMVSAARTLGRSKCLEFRQRQIPIPREDTICDKLTEGSFSSGPAAWRYDGGYGKLS
jgi:hypothetical protein